MNKKMKDIVNENRNIIDTVLPEVENLLKRKKVKYISNSKNTEIVIDNKEKITEDDIVNSLFKTLKIPRMVLDILLEVKKSKQHTYIRLRIKDKK